MPAATSGSTVGAWVVPSMRRFGIADTEICVVVQSRDTGFSASRKSASATSPESVYSQRCSATSGGWKEGSAWAARPTARLLRPLDWLDTQGSYHDVRPPGSPSIPLALNIWQSHGSTHRKPAPEERTPPYCRSNSTVTRHQTTNGGMFLAKSAPDLKQRLPRLPTTPHVALLLC